MKIPVELAGLVRERVELAPLTHSGIGGTVEYLAVPTSRGELLALVAAARAAKTPVHVLGSGSRVLIGDGIIPGLVLRLSDPSFAGISISGATVTAGAGASLVDLVAKVCAAGLTGTEPLVGLSGTVGGAICGSGGGAGEIADILRSVEVIDEEGKVVTRERGDSTFGSALEDSAGGVVLSARFDLSADAPESIIRAMRRNWIHRKASLPYTWQKGLRVFRDIPGADVSHLIDRSKLARTRVGLAEVSERNGNYIIVSAGAKSADVLTLIGQMADRVKSETGESLERELILW